MYPIIRTMREDFIIGIFRRDLASITGGHYDFPYVLKLLRYSVEHYMAERALPDWHQAKIFSDEEYQLLIDLYTNELHQLQLT